MITKPSRPQDVKLLSANLLARAVALLDWGPFQETDRARVCSSSHPAHCTRPERELGAGEEAARTPQPRARLMPQDQVSGAHLPIWPFCRGPSFPCLMPTTEVAQHPQVGASQRR